MRVRVCLEAYDVLFVVQETVEEQASGWARVLVFINLFI